MMLRIWWTSLCFVLVFGRARAAPRCCACGDDIVDAYTIVDYTVTVSDDAVDTDVTQVIGIVLQVYVDHQVLDVDTATRLLTGCKGPKDQAFSKDMPPLKAEDLAALNINCKECAKEKFLRNLKEVLDKPCSPAMLKVILELGLETSAISMAEVIAITVEHGILINVNAKRRDPSLWQVAFKRGDMMRSTVTVSKVRFPKTLVTLVTQLLQVIVKYDIIDESLAKSILVTFRVNSDSNAQPLTKDSIPKLTIKSKPYAQKKFVRSLLANIDKASSPESHVVATKLLIELLLDTANIDVETATKILKVFGMDGDIQFKLYKDAPIITDDMIKTGEASDSEVVIKDFEEEEWLVPLIIRILDVLKKADVLKEESIIRFLITFNVEFMDPFKPADKPALTEEDVLKMPINARRKPRIKFIANTVKLIKSSKPDRENPVNILKILFELSIDSGAMDLATVVKITKLYTIGGAIQAKLLPKFPVFPDEKIVAGEPSDSEVKFKEVAEIEFVMPFIVRAFQILKRATVVEDATISRILASFYPCVEATDAFGAQGNTLTDDDVKKLPVKAIRRPRDKFRRMITKLQKRKYAGKCVITDMIELLLVAMIDTGALDAKTAGEMAVIYGFTVTIKSKILPKIPYFPDDRIRAGALSLSEVIIIDVKEVDFVLPFILRVIEIVKKRSLLSDHVISKLWVTYKLESCDEFRPLDMDVLEDNDITHLEVAGHRIARAKLIQSVKEFVKKPAYEQRSTYDYIIILLELLIDNGVISKETAEEALKLYTFNSKVTVDLFPVFLDEKVVQGQLSECQVSITDAKVPDFVDFAISRLFEILKKNSVVDDDAINRLLITYGVQYPEPFTPSGANALTKDDIAALKISGGRRRLRARFTNRFTSVFEEKKGCKLVEQLLELVLDYAIMDVATANAFLQAYTFSATVTCKALPTWPDSSIHSGQLSISTVKVTKSQCNEYVGSLVNRILLVAMKTTILDESVATRMMATFNVEPEEPFGPDRPAAITEDAVKALAVKLDRKKLRIKFERSFVAALQEKDQDQRLLALIQVLLELLLDTGEIDANTAADLSAPFCVELDIKIKKYKDMPIITDDMIKPGEPSDSEVIIKDSEEPDWIVPLTIRILEILMKKDVIREQFIVQLLVTCNIEFLEPFKKTDSKPLADNDVTNMYIKARRVPKTKFIGSILKHIKQDKPEKENLLRIVLEFAIDSGIIDVTVVTEIVKLFDISASIKSTLLLKFPVFPDEKIVAGELSESDVKYNEAAEIEFVMPFVIRAFEILKRGGVIDEATIVRLLTTCSLEARESFNFKDATAIAEGDVKNLKFKTLRRTQLRFKAAVSGLTKKGSQCASTDFIEPLIVFMIDTGVLNANTAGEMAVIYGLSVSIKSQVLPKVPVFPDEKIRSGALSVSRVSITDAKEDHFILPFLLRIIEIVKARSLLTDVVISRLWVTYRLEACDEFKLTDTKPFADSDLDNLPVAAHKRVKVNFITSIREFLKKPATEECCIHNLIEVLIQLLLDSGVFNVDTANEAFALFTFNAKIVSKVIPVFPDDKIQQGVLSESQVAITDVADKDFVDFAIVRVCDILKKKSIFDDATINSFLATYKVEYGEPFNPDGAKPLGKDEVGKLTINGGRRRLRAKFVRSVVDSLDSDTKSAKLVALLLELLLDYSVMDVATAQLFLQTYTFSATVNSRPLPFWPDSKIHSGELSISNVKVTKLVSKDYVGSLVNRILLLAIKTTVLDEAVATRILATFNVETEEPFGTDRPDAINGDAVASLTVKLDRKKLRSKFDKSFSSVLLEKDQDQRVLFLIQVLLELLIDSGVIDPNTAADLAATYSVELDIKAKRYKEMPIITDDMIKRGEASDSEVVIKEFEEPDWIVPLTVRILEILKNSGVIKEEAIIRMLITFKIPFMDPFKQTDGSALTEDDVPKMYIKARRVPKTKLIANTVKLVKQGKVEPVEVLRVLLIFCIDSGVIDITPVTAIVNLFDITASLKATLLPKWPYFPDEKIVDGDPSDSEVKYKEYFEIEFVIPFIERAFQILKRGNVIDDATINRLFATFGLEACDSYSSNGAKPLTDEEIKKLPVTTTRKPRDKIRRLLVKLLKRKEAGKCVATDMIEPLLTFLIDSGVLHVKAASEFAVIFGLTVTIKSTLLPKIPVFPDSRIRAGGLSVSRVEIIDVKEDYFVLPFILRVIEIVTTRKLLNDAAISKLWVTYRLEACEEYKPVDKEPLEKEDVRLLEAKAPKKARIKFYRTIRRFLEKPAYEQRSTYNFIEVLMELLIDNGVINLETANEMLTLFTFNVKVSARLIPTFADDKIVEGQPADCQVTISEAVEPEFVDIAAGRIFEILKKKAIMEQDTIHRFLVTYRVFASEEFKPAGSDPLTKDDIANVQINAKAEAVAKFKQRLADAFDSDVTPRQLKLAETMVQLMSDIGTMDTATAKLFLQTYLLSATMDCKGAVKKVSRTIPTFTDEQIIKGKVCISTINVRKINYDLFLPFINRLLSILTGKSIINVATANRILATFRVEPGDPFKASTVLAEADVAGLEIKAEKEPKDKFIKALLEFVKKPLPDTEKDLYLVKILLELLVDSGTMDEQTAMNLTITFLISILIEVRQITIKKEPTMKAGTLPPAGTRIDSAMSIEKVISPMPPCVIRLLELLVAGNVFDDTDANSILATFSLQAGGRFSADKGAALTADTIGNLKVSGEPEPAKKFFQSMKMVFSVSGKDAVQRALIKIFFELLIDNAVVDAPSAVQLAKYYGIGTQLMVKTVTYETKLMKGSETLDGANRLNTVTINKVLAKDLNPLVNKLLESAVAANLLSQDNAAKLLAGFGITGGNIPTSGVAGYTVGSEIAVSGDAEAKTKFIKTVEAAFGKGDAERKPTLIKGCLELLLDNEKISLDDAASLAVRLGVSVEIQGGYKVHQ